MNNKGFKMLIRSVKGNLLLLLLYRKFTIFMNKTVLFLKIGNSTILAHEKITFLNIKKKIV